MAVETTPSSTSVTPQQQVLQLATGYWLSSVMYAVTALEIPDRLRFGPRSATDLAAETGVNADRLYRVMRAAAMAGVFTEVSPGTFALTPVGDVLRPGVDGTLHDYVKFVADPNHMRMFSYMPEMIKTGDMGQYFAFGSRGWEYFERHPDLSAIFDDAMTNLTKLFGPAMIAAYDFSGIGTLVDVAGGHGAMISMALQRYPQMRGVILEIPSVVPGARMHLSSIGLGERCTVVAGNYNESVPRGDAIMMKYIVHSSDDPAADLLLRNCRKALENSKVGKLILFENVVPEGDTPHMAKLLDLEMMAIPGGRERTAEQYRTLLDKSGFRMTRVIPTQTPCSVIEAVRA
jgi:hypothetical protein